jgi:hypothetical protein
MKVLQVKQKTNNRMSVKFSLQRFIILMGIVIVSMAFTSCSEGENGTDPDNNSSYPEKAAVKYLQVHLIESLGGDVHDYVIFDNYGKRFRTDVYGPLYNEGKLVDMYGHWQTQLEDHGSKTMREINYYTLGGQWENKPYKSEKQLEVAFMSVQKIVSNGSFKKQTAQITLAGKPCDVYTATLAVGADNFTYTYAMWNNIEMLYETKYSASGKILARREAVAVSLDVPEAAFTGTMDITWLPK